jgi:uncharacterized protein HemX
MDQEFVLTAPTSEGTTSETEPEVRAAIESAPGNPELPTQIRADDDGVGLGRVALILVTGLAIGGAAAYWLRRRA